MFDPALGKGLRFKVEDLKANQVGKLSERQLERIGSMISGYFAVLVVWGGLLIILGRLNTLYPELRGTHWCIFGNAIVFVIIGVSYSTSRKERANRRVEVIEGKIERFEEIGRTAGRLWFVFIGGRRLLVDREGYEALGQDRVYRLYYTPSSKHVVSAEIVPRNR